MDLRIVNTCNNNCAYCLEQSLRLEKKFFKKEYIFSLLRLEQDKNFLGFYGGNPLLHPNLLDIIKYAHELGFVNIGILTNSYGLDKLNLTLLKKYGVSTFGIYFNSFDHDIHNLLVGHQGIQLKELLKNLYILKSREFFIKIIIHLNKQNISTVYRDIFILNKKYGIDTFEFINYFPFDRPYKKFGNILGYDIVENRDNINNLFNVINKLNLNVSFKKFSLGFFGKNKEYFDYKDCILSNLSLNEINILNGDTIPSCKQENKCKFCFLQDICKWNN